MAQKHPSGNRIPASKLAAVKPWALPRVESGHVVTSPFQEKQRQQQAASQSVEEELDLSSLTVEALQRLREEARAEGFESGRKEGLASGEQEGREQGLTAGHEAGYQAAYQQGQAEIDALKARLSGLISQLVEPLGQQHNALEQQLVQMVESIAQAVIARELATRPELMLDTVRQALRVLPQDGSLSLAVSPDDETLIRELQSREGGSWELRPDPGLQPGDLVVRGMNSYLDYRVDQRLQTVLQQLHQDRDEQAAVQGDEPDAE